jgi:hypothetical protein
LIICFIFSLIAYTSKFTLKWKRNDKTNTITSNNDLKTIISVIGTARDILAQNTADKYDEQEWKSNLDAKQFGNKAICEPQTFAWENV